MAYLGILGPHLGLCRRSWAALGAYVGGLGPLLGLCGRAWAFETLHRRDEQLFAISGDVGGATVYFRDAVLFVVLVAAGGGDA